MAQHIGLRLGTRVFFLVYLPFFLPVRPLGSLAFLLSKSIY